MTKLCKKCGTKLTLIDIKRIEPFNDCKCINGNEECDLYECPDCKKQYIMTIHSCVHTSNISDALIEFN